MPIKVQKANRTPNRQAQERNSASHLMIKTLTVQDNNNKMILKAEQEKDQITDKGRPIRITPDFSIENVKVRRAWTDVLQVLKDHRCQPRLSYPAKLSVVIEGEKKLPMMKTNLRNLGH